MKTRYYKITGNVSEQQNSRPFHTREIQWISPTAARAAYTRLCRYDITHTYHIWSWSCDLGWLVTDKIQIFTCLIPVLPRTILTFLTHLLKQICFLARKWLIIPKHDIFSESSDPGELNGGCCHFLWHTILAQPFIKHKILGKKYTKINFSAHKHIFWVKYIRWCGIE